MLSTMLISQALLFLRHRTVTVKFMSKLHFCQYIVLEMGLKSKEQDKY